MPTDNPTTLVALVTAAIVIAIIPGGVEGNSSSWWCPLHCAAPRKHPCPGEDGTPAGKPIPEVAGGLDNAGNCRPQDHGRFMYHFISNDQGGKQCVKCYCFQDSVDFEMIDPSCYKVENRICTQMGAPDPKTSHMKHAFGKKPLKNSVSNASTEMSSSSSEVPKRTGRPPPIASQALHNCMYFGIDCNPTFFMA